jgi:hypothetical protein
MISQESKTEHVVQSVATGNRARWVRGLDSHDLDRSSFA